MKKPKGAKKPPPKPRNLAAKSLRDGQFQPKREVDPKAYKRRAKHEATLLRDPDEEDGNASRQSKE